MQYVLEKYNSEVKGLPRYWQCTYSDGKFTEYGWGKLATAQIISRDIRPLPEHFTHSHWIKGETDKLRQGKVKKLTMKVSVE